MNKYIALLLLICPASVHALSVTLMSVDETCGQDNGSIVAWVGGGVPPYSFQWSNGATTETITGLTEGSYWVDVTDDVGTVASANVYVFDGPLIPWNMGWTPAGGLPCPGQCNGGFSIPLEGLNGQQPYSLSLNTGIVADPSYPHPLFTGFCDLEPITLTVTDGTGCAGTLELFLDGPNAPPIEVTNVNGSCAGQANGSVLLLMPEETAWDSWYYVYVFNEAEQSVGGYSGEGPAQVLVEYLYPGTYTIERTHSATLDGCPDISSFEIPDMGNDCGSVSGDNWYDVDADCALDAGEVGIPYRIIEIQPGPEYAITSGNGRYYRNLQNGSYTLAQTDPTLIPICPLPQPVPFSLSNSTAVIDLADGSTTPLDLMVSAAQGGAIPGQALALHASVVNSTPQVSGPITLTCTFDAALDLTSAEPAPTDVQGNSITWELPALGSFGSSQVSISLFVPVGTALGIALSNVMELSTTLPESSTANNIAALTTVVTGPFDPNFKEARTSDGQSSTTYFIDQDSSITYTIHFQNTGTAEAVNVIVTDTVGEELDMSTFKQGVASHAFDVSIRPGRVVEWRFENIHLPDSNANEPLSHGLVCFTIRPTQPLLPGTLIQNAANIFFDFNPPVITEPSLLTAEFSTGLDQVAGEALRVFPNPVTSLLQLNPPPRIAGLRIRAGDGRLVMARANVNGLSSVDVQHLPSGAYSVEVMMDGGDVHRARFIKQ